MRTTPRASAMVTTLAFSLLAACEGIVPKKVEVTGQLPVPVQGSVQVEGPILVQMQGPSIRYEGTFVSEDIFEAIEPNKTSMAWVLAVLGEPDRRATLDDGSELLVWAYRLAAVEGSIVDVFTIGDGDKKAPANVTTVLRAANGIVLEKWRG